MYTVPLTLEITTSQDATIAKIVAPVEAGALVLAEGTAKRHPSDPYNLATGVNLATARAFKAYGEVVENLFS